MRPEASEHLRQIGVALERHDEQHVIAAASGLIEDEPANAALLIWARFSSESDTYFRRVLAYVLAKTAANGSKYVWGPLATFVVSPYTDDSSTLINVLSALQIFDEHDDILSAVLAPEFGAFALHCLVSSALVVGAFCDLIPHLSDRGFLARVLSRSQVRAARDQLGAFSRTSDADINAALAILSEENFEETLPDATFRIDREDELLIREPPVELDASSGFLLRSILANSRSSYVLRKQAQEVDGVVQQIRLTNGDSTKGRLAIDVFERLVRTWRSVIREVAQSRQPERSSAISTYMLAPAQGSFVIRFLVESNRDQILLQSLDEISELAANPEKLSLQDGLTTESRSNIVQFLETLAQNNLDATLGILDAYRFERSRRRILSSEIRPAIRRIRDVKQEHSITRLFPATLEGASHRQGTFEALAEGLGYVRGEVPSEQRLMLLHKVIGRRYNFKVEERVTTSGTGEVKQQFILYALSTLDEDDGFSGAEALEKPTELSTNDVPQQDRLDRVVAVVGLLASKGEVPPKALEMADTASSRRHIDYMRQAAKILGLLTDNGVLTGAGRTLAQLPESRVLDFLSVQFEVSNVARLWKIWSHATDLHELDESSAEQFLLDKGLSRSMAERRSRTLRKWLSSFKSLHATE